VRRAAALPHRKANALLAPDVLDHISFLFFRVLASEPRYHIGPKEANTEMAKNRKTNHELASIPGRERPARGERVMDLYKTGMFVKALDESGEPKFLGGSQVYKSIEDATATERAFWDKENKID
jgi:hypothetical protein